MRRLLAGLAVLGAAHAAWAQQLAGVRRAVVFDAGSVPRLEGSATPAVPTGSLVDALSAKGYNVAWIEGKGFSRYETLRQMYGLTELSEADSVVVYCGGYVVRRPAVQGGTYWLQEEGSLESLETRAVRLEELAFAFRKIPARRKVLLLDFVFLGDAAYAPDADAKAQQQRKMSFYPEVSLERGSLPLAELAALGEIEPVSHLALVLKPEAASQLGGRGLLGTLVRDAIIGVADRDSDGMLRADEMVRYIRNAVEERASGAGLPLLSFQLATRLEEDWVFAIAGESVTRARRDRYLGTLRDWRDRNWISARTELAARSVLNAWVRSFENETSLDPKNQELWDILQRHMEGSGNDVDRARSLEAYFQKRY